MIPMLDLKTEFLDIEDEVISAVVRVLKSTRYILGPHVTGFEDALRRYYDTRHAVGVASGTDALYLSLAALGIGKGDEVITTPFTFFATVESIILMGASPVFVDIDPVSMNIDAARIEERITPRTRAILPVHLFGLPCGMDEIVRVAKKHGLHIVEDCAQSFGASYKGKKTGTFGDTGCFSFYPSKNLGCYGDGGAVITGNDALHEKITMLRNHGSSAGYVHEKIGFNSRLDEIQAAILSIKLKKVDEKNAWRRRLAALYTSLLKDRVICPHEPEGFSSCYHQYTIRSPRREAIREALHGQDIASVVYYPIPMHLQKPIHVYGYAKGALPHAERAANEVLSLPIYPGMKEEDVRGVSEVISKCLGG
jgi:dTDP-4-amino-4,6-dideoxygalactose transaminase